MGMKRTCIQCGKEFELTGSEISFYKGKKLSLPKRCKECRAANKQSKGDNRIEGAETTENTKSAEKKAQKAEKVGEAARRKELAGEKLMETAATELLAQVRNTGSNGKGNKVFRIIAAVAAVIVLGLLTWLGGNDNNESSDTPEETVEYEFRSEEQLQEHFDKHGEEMGYATPEDYVEAANQVVMAEDVLHKLEEEDGDDVYYLEETNEFVVISQDGYLRTYFWPEDGKDYFDRQ